VFVSLFLRLRHSPPDSTLHLKPRRLSSCGCQFLALEVSLDRALDFVFASFLLDFAAISTMVDAAVVPLYGPALLRQFGLDDFAGKSWANVDPDSIDDFQNEIAKADERRSSVARSVPRPFESFHAWKKC
jgi:hypothetical protein